MPYVLVTQGGATLIWVGAATAGIHGILLVRLLCS
jgi:hypothetical protein